jgi:hypothetical protein
VGRLRHLWPLAAKLLPAAEAVDFIAKTSADLARDRKTGMGRGISRDRREAMAALAQIDHPSALYHLVRIGLDPQAPEAAAELVDRLNAASSASRTRDLREKILHELKALPHPVDADAGRIERLAFRRALERVLRGLEVHFGKPGALIRLARRAEGRLPSHEQSRLQLLVWRDAYDREEKARAT